MTTLSITLPPETGEFVEAESRRQGFATPDEFVGKLIIEAHRSSEAHDIEEKLLAGLASGPGTPFDETWAARMKERVLSGKSDA
jgi:hypothetical protein